ncbi:MAG: hypothetical protein KGZ59_04460 [Chitinophagaceae bacterium]|nr:hypothetical protein [Chitinophagaceae bacterium]
MKNQILSNWNFMRVLRLIFGIIILIQSIITKQYTFSIIGLLFSLLAVFNVSCCGTSCSTNFKQTNNKSEDLVYEEVSTTK